METLDWMRNGENYFYSIRYVDYAIENSLNRNKLLNSGKHSNYWQIKIIKEIKDYLLKTTLFNYSNSVLC